MTIGKSARGVRVDFDLLKIKQQIGSTPPSQEVKRRKDFIENRLRRRTKKTVTVAPVEVEPKIAPTDKDELQDVIIEEAEVTSKEPTTPKKTKQKARPPKIKTEEDDTTNKSD